MTFFNTVVMILIVNCNFIESEVPVLRKLLQIGSHTDFNRRWYKLMGPMLLLTVFFNAIVPLGIFVKNAAFWLISRAYDNKCFRRS